MNLISLYFGGSIYSATSNQYITHLNEMENISNYSVDAIPALSQLAAFVTMPFVLLIMFFAFMIRIRSNNTNRRKVAGGMLMAIGIIFTVDVSTIINPDYFDFGGWGFVWITLSILIIAGNIYSYFLKEKV
ncbi:MAG: hypothetical protein MK078_04060 [Crocinitomicaceae bacterium]|nr:hypothetical protein [Crocinitomicaceae bacterium]